MFIDIQPFGVQNAQDNRTGIPIKTQSHVLGDTLTKLTRVVNTLLFIWANRARN